MIQTCYKNDCDERTVVIVALLLDAPLLALVFTALAPVLPLISEEHQHSNLIAQLIMTTPSAGMILGGIVGGFLVDRFNKKTILFGSMGAYAAFGTAGIYIHDTQLLLISRFCLGLAAITITTANGWLLASLLSPAKRMKIIGLRTAIGSIGGVVSTILAGYLAGMYGWKASFYIYFLVLPILFWSAIFLPGEKNLRTKQPEKDYSLLRTNWPIYLSIIPVSIMLMAAVTQISFVLKEKGISDPLQQSFILSISSVFSIFGSAIFGYIRAGGPVVFSICIFFLGFGHIAAGALDGEILLALGGAVIGFGSGLANPFFCNLIIERTPEEVRGRGLGLLATFVFFGDFINPFVYSYLNTFFSISGSFVLVGIISVTLSLIVLLNKPRWISPDPSYVVPPKSPQID